MTFSADAITDVQIDVANETKGYGADIADEMVKKILDAQSSEVDGHSGATITSDAIRKAAESCINQAKGVAVAPTEANKAETVVPDSLSVEEVESSVCELGDITPDETKDFDVVVVGAGAAGVAPPQAGLPSWAAMWPCCRSRASWSARATAALPSSSPSPPTRARRCGCT